MSQHTPIRSRRPLGALPLLPFLLMVVAGCGSGGEAPSTAGAAAPDGWQVERTTTEDGATLVRNLSGSRWGGDAVAREELSIGVQEGVEEAMLSRPTAVWLTEDEIFVLDSQENHVRVYDYEGGFRRQFGRSGQGPGELTSPLAMVGLPDGRLLIGGGMANGRISVFSPEGEHLEDWSLGSFNPAFQLWITGDAVYSRKMALPQPGGDVGDVLERMQAYQRVGPDGFEGEPFEIPSLGTGARITVEVMGQQLPLPLPGGAMTTLFDIAPDGRHVIGFPDTYRFEIRDPDTGSTIVVERTWDPVPISRREAEETLELMLAPLRAQVPGLELGEVDLPRERAAYSAFRVHRDGRLWVAREGEGRREEGCEMPETFALGTLPRSCWSTEVLTDVFDLEGNYLGGVQKENGEGIGAVDVLGDRIATIETDELDTPMVKIYRLVLPAGATR